jgi:HPt (histidine-containing phosphotransfer) domain-containing protein
MNLEECYEAMDSDYDDVMRRLGSETLVRKFVLKFLDDTSFQGLKEGLENQDAELAFRSAHTLKGVCMNLGFTKLFEVSSALTEELRDKENSTEMFEAVEREYTRTIEAIKGLC